MCEFKEPKTDRSRRLVSMTSKLAAFLREYRQDRKFLYNELGKNLTLDDLVFANVRGEPLNPPSLSREFNHIVKRAGLENVRFHDLRHTFASLMLLRGAKPKVISEALGHASVAFTMDVYSHIIEGMQSDAMALLDDVLPVAKNGIPQIINAKSECYVEYQQNINFRRGDRVAYGGGLENRSPTLLGRGFESHPLRHNLSQTAILIPSVDNYEKTSKKPTAGLFYFNELVFKIRK